MHGVLGSLIRRPATLPPTPRLPDPFDVYWARDWGVAVAEAASAALARPVVRVDVPAMAVTY